MKPSESDIIETENTNYKGVPRNWKRIDGVDDAIRNSNPFYSVVDRGYSTNCTNCVSAYEMRKRGYDVTAQPATNNHYLSKNPEAAWINPEVQYVTRSGREDIIDAMGELPDGARIEVAVTWKGNTDGHVFVAEKVNNRVDFMMCRLARNYLQQYLMV